MDTFMHLGHEFMKMCAALAPDPRHSKKAPYGIARARAEQPAKRRGRVVALTRELRLERRQHAHYRLLHRIALDEPSRHARRVGGRYRSLWPRKIKHYKFTG